MNRKHFLASQLWLRHLSAQTMEELHADLKFHTLLMDAFCCFEVDRSLVFFAAERQGAEQSSAPSDATQLRLQILISLDDRTDDQAIRAQQVAPGLYFILDGQAYIVNHTLISKISFPQHSSGSQEPPSACIGWPGVQMRWWLAAGIPPNIMVQRLSYAVGTMNKMLLPLFLPHYSITDTHTDRHPDGHLTSATGTVHRDHRLLPLSLTGTSTGSVGDIASYSRHGIKARYLDRQGLERRGAAVGAANSGVGGDGGLRGVSGGSKKRSRTDIGTNHENNNIYNDNNNMNNNDMNIEIRIEDRIEGIDESSSALHLRCIDTWMAFLSSVSDLLAVPVDAGMVCDSFLGAKQKRGGDRVGRGEGKGENRGDAGGGSSKQSTALAVATSDKDNKANNNSSSSSRGGGDRRGSGTSSGRGLDPQERPPEGYWEGAQKGCREGGPAHGGYEGVSKRTLQGGHEETHKWARNGETHHGGHKEIMQEGEGAVVEYKVDRSLVPPSLSPYNEAAVLFISSVLSAEEAKAAEGTLEALRMTQEKAVEGLLRELYSYGDDREGGGGRDQLSNNRIMAQMDGLLREMADASDHTALLRGMPRTDL